MSVPLKVKVYIRDLKPSRSFIFKTNTMDLGEFRLSYIIEAFIYIKDIY